MHLKTLLTLTLSTLAISSSAIPFNQRDSQPNPSPTTDVASSIDNADDASEVSHTSPAPSTQASELASLIVDNAMDSADNVTCPASRRSKQCCNSLNGLGDSLFGGLGKIIPYLKNVELSSVLGLNCTGMADDQPNDTCAKDVMCCGGQPDQDNEKELQSKCEPFQEAMDKKHKNYEASKSHMKPYKDHSGNSNNGNSPAAAASSAPAASSGGAGDQSG